MGNLREGIERDDVKWGGRVLRVCWGVWILFFYLWGGFFMISGVREKGIVISVLLVRYCVNFLWRDSIRIKENSFN